MGLPTGYGDAEKYELWEAKFLGYMSLKELKKTILPATSSDEALDENKNEQAYSELIQFLDDVSLSLVIRGAKDNGRKALEILRTHYAGLGKFRLLTLYTELTSLVKAPSESITEYILSAEKSANALRNAGENFSDGLLICVILKGLPEEYKPFAVVISRERKNQISPRVR